MAAPPSCKYPGCPTPCKLENGVYGDFCGMKHAMAWKVSVTTGTPLPPIPRLPVQPPDQPPVYPVVVQPVMPAYPPAVLPQQPPAAPLGFSGHVDPSVYPSSSDSEDEEEYEDVYDDPFDSAYLATMAAPSAMAMFDYPNDCQYPGCDLEGFIDDDGTQYDYCSMLHQKAQYTEQIVALRAQVAALENALQIAQQKAAQSPVIVKPKRASMPPLQGGLPDQPPDANAGGLPAVPPGGQLPATPPVKGKKVKVAPSPGGVLPASPPAHGLPQQPPNVLPARPPVNHALPANPPNAGLPQQPPSALPTNPPNALPQQPPSALPANPPNAGLPPQPPNAGLPQNPPNAGLPQQPPNAGLPVNPPGSPLPANPPMPAHPPGYPPSPGMPHNPPNGMPHNPPMPAHMPHAPPVNMPNHPPAAAALPTCALPGCSKSVYVGQDGVPGKYCSNGHRKAGAAPAGSCNRCFKHPAAAPGKNACQRCYWKSTGVTTIWDNGDEAAALLPPTHPEYESTEKQFVGAWKHMNKQHLTPHVVSIVAIHCKQQLRDAFDKKRDQVEAEGHFEGRNGKNGRKMTRGNLCLRFHGTTRLCRLGIDGNATLCNNKSCFLCCIMKTNFMCPKMGANFQRFGPGIYFTATSSKADDYNTKSQLVANGKTIKCTIVARVIIGKGQVIKVDDVKRTAPDTGHHSVLGEVDKSVAGANLNYDECVVYEPASVLPGYIVNYYVT